MAARFLSSVPSVAVQILLGVILGSALLGLNPNNSGIAFLAGVGLFAIFFEVGLEFDLTAPELTSTTPARSALSGVISSFLLVLLVVFLLGNSSQSSLLIALATVSTSVSVAVYSFLNLGPLVHLEAKVAVLAGLFDDLLGITTLSVLASVLSNSLGGIVSLAISLVVVLGSYLAQRKLAGRCFDLGWLRRYLLVLTLVAAMVLLWNRFGLTLAIAGFVAGAFSGPMLPRNEQLLLSSISRRLGPFFMISLGLLVNFRHGLTFSDVLGIIAISVALIVSKGATALVMGKQLEDRVLYWFSMVPRAEVAGTGMVLVASRVPAPLELQAILAIVATALITPFVISRRVRGVNRSAAS